ncbi:MAG: histidine kinase [Clostridiales Family XIII bacterium]|nr:histidine kinase [Clostridiales Family XIII bacterium]
MKKEKKVKKEKKRGPVRFRLKVLTIINLVAALIFCAVLLFGILNRYLGGSPIVFWGSLAGLAAALLILALYFKRQVYDPIKKIERALEVVSDADDIADFEIDIPEDHELYLLSSYLNKMIDRMKDFANREYTATLLAKQAEINALQMQINPHFLYNTLDSIRGLAIKEGVTDIANMTKALSRLFRYSISNKNDFSTLREEINNAESYMTIQQLRFANKFVFITDIDVNEDPDIFDYCLPKLTIQPIIENSVFYGLETKLGKGKIILHAYITQKRLIISIEDNGLGMEQQRLDDINGKLSRSLPSAADNAVSSIGLVNVNERIHLYFGQEYGIHVMSTQNVGTIVEIMLPLMKK